MTAAVLAVALSLSAGVIRVPQDAPTIPAAVAAAASGDTVLVDRGTYPGGVVVPEDRPSLTIRGVDRNAVVFDGQDARDDAIDVRADGVTLHNLSAHDFRKNAFYWDGVTGFTGSYLTVWNVLGYGIYSEDSTGGLIEHDYVSGAADAAYYIGECNPCRSTIRQIVARLSAVGYSGANASGALVIRDSVWDRNGAGILPNSLANEKDPPQEDAVIPATSSPRAAARGSRSTRRSPATTGSGSASPAATETAFSRTPSRAAGATGSRCSARRFGSRRGCRLRGRGVRGGRSGTPCSATPCGGAASPTSRSRLRAAPPTVSGAIAPRRRCRRAPRGAPAPPPAAARAAPPPPRP